jgi:hypothetical protein
LTVFEDDAYLVSPERLSEFVDCDWATVSADVINWGTSTITGFHGQDAEPYLVKVSHDNFVESKITSTSHAVTYMPQFASKFLKKLQSKYYAAKVASDPIACIDYLYGSHIELPEIVQWIPSRGTLFRQYDNFSDVSGIQVSYETFFDQADQDLATFLRDGVLKKPARLVLVKPTPTRILLSNPRPTYQPVIQHLNLAPKKKKLTVTLKGGLGNQS